MAATMSAYASDLADSLDFVPRPGDNLVQLNRIEPRTSLEVYAAWAASLYSKGPIPGGWNQVATQSKLATSHGVKSVM